MKIYFDGDSFTRGDELIDPNKCRFSRLISDHYKTEEYNFSEDGNCNGAIVRRLIVENNIKEYDLAVIQMSLPVRMEYYNGKKYKNLREKDFMEWKRFYLKHIYHDTFGNDYEYLYYMAIKNHCGINNVPLVITTNRSYKKYRIDDLRRKFKHRHSPSDERTNFDLYLDSSRYPRAKRGHPNREGHRMIADDLIGIIDKLL